MRVTKQKEVKSIEIWNVGITCDKCGKTDTDEDGYIVTDINPFSIGFGYGSKRDGEKWEIDLCDDCLDEVFKDIKDKIYIKGELMVTSDFLKLEDSFLTLDIVPIAEAMIVLDREKALQLADMIQGLTMIEDIADGQTVIDFDIDEKPTKVLL